jgi:LuxR family transcriptional regulator, maltose regulon positive regulatory protein
VPAATGQRVPARRTRRTSRFSTTKFTPPAVPARDVERPRLLRQLDAVRDVPVAVVVGIAGSGKSSLLAQWAAGQPTGTVCWINADTADADPARFLRALIESVRTVRPDFGQDCLDLLTLDDAVDADTIETLLTETDRLDPPVTVVVDDLHLVGSTTQERLAFAIERGTGSLHLLLASRTRPTLGLHRLRLRDACRELGDRDLALDADEARGLLERLGVEPDDRIVDVLLERTEGWAVGLHLAAVVLRDAADPHLAAERIAGADATTEQYLTNEVLLTQPPEIRRFLLDTCIVDELSPALAAALSPGTPVGLRDLEAANLPVVRLGTGDERFRYHHLVAEVLRSLLRESDPSHELTLHRRAADWYAEHDERMLTFQHRWRARQRTDALEMYRDRIVDDYLHDRLPSVDVSEGLLSDDDLRTSPAAAIRLCSMLTVDGRGEEADRLAHRIDAVAGPGLDHGTRVELLSTRTWCALGSCDTRSSFEHGAALLDLAPRSARDEDLVALATGMYVRAATWEGRFAEAEFAIASMQGERADLLALVEQGSATAQLRWAQGHLADAVQLATAAVEAIEEQQAEHPSADLPARAVLGATLLELGRLDEAELQLRIIHDRSDGPRIAITVLALVELARLVRSHGQVDEAFSLLDRAGDLLRRAPVDSGVRRHLRTWRARFLLDAGELDRATELLAAIPLEDRAVPEARVALAQGRTGRALDVFGRIVGARPETATIRARLEVDLLAVELDLSGLRPDPNAAARAFETAAEGGFVFTIAEAGLDTFEAVRAVARRRPHTEHIGRLLRAAPHDTGPNRPTARFAFETLSDRERTVLRYLATTMSYREIADELYVSVNTVKTHVKNVIRKLQASSRTDAIQRARDLHYL